MAADVEKIRFNDGYLQLSSDSQLLESIVDLNVIDDAQQRASYELSSLLTNFLVAQRQLQLCIEHSRATIGKGVDLSNLDRLYERYQSVNGYKFLKFLRDYAIHQARPTFMVARLSPNEYSVGLSLEGYESSNRFKGPPAQYISQLRDSGHSMLDINSLVVTGGTDLGRVAETLYECYIELWNRQ